jgi:hypothetical protein
MFASKATTRPVKKGKKKRRNGGESGEGKQKRKRIVRVDIMNNSTFVFELILGRINVRTI